MKQDRSELLTKIGPGAGAGKVLRQYWLPAALSDELDLERPVVPVTLMGESLVLFRTPSGELGLIDRQCPHRGVDLCYGRLEDKGLRCVFHGWQFSPDGQCLEQPAEPIGSKLHEKIKTTAYPVIEKNGIVFAFLGEGLPPEFPELDCFRAPDTNVFAFKGRWQCNWLQALEVGIDPAHASFLHRFFTDDDPEDQYGKQFRDTAADTDLPLTQVLRDYDRPEIIPELTEFGIRIKTLRRLGEDKTHVRVTNQIFPCAIVIPMSKEMTITQWHVPIDDQTCFWYAMFTSFTEPVNKEKMREQRLAEHSLPDYAPNKNQSNNYGFDAEEQKNRTYTGMGEDINVHDQWACESMGRVQDRTKEHLGTTDKAISAYRRLLLQAITKRENDENPEITGVGFSGPIAIDAIGPTETSETFWVEDDAKRRANCPWDANL